MTNKVKKQFIFFLYGIESIWDYFCLFLRDVKNHDTRKCPGCCRQLRFDNFLGLYSDIEYIYCLECRGSGKPLTQNTVWEQPVVGNQPRNAVVYNNNYIYKPKPPDYFVVSIEEASQFWLDPLLYGEKFDTWGSLYDESPVAVKLRRIERERNRKWCYTPWRYDAVAASQLERNMRERCERLWRHGFDEHLPEGLLENASWNRFWNFYITKTIG